MASIPEACQLSWIGTEHVSQIAKDTAMNAQVSTMNALWSGHELVVKVGDEANQAVVGGLSRR